MTMTDRERQIDALCRGMDPGRDEYAVGLALDVLALLHDFDAKAASHATLYNMHALSIGEALVEAGLLPPQ